MITVILGLEGEYGRRLARYLEGHMDRTIRLRYFTRPAQWAADVHGDLYVLDTSFYSGLPQETAEGLSKDKILWVRDQEDEQSYCRFHPPERLKEMVMVRTGAGGRPSSDLRKKTGLTGMFSPADDPRFPDLIRLHIQPGDLYLGMRDLGAELVKGETGSLDGGSHMGDLSYYIHLREPEIMTRIREMCIRTEGYDILPSPAIFLPLTELSREDYSWFFDQLKDSHDYGHIYVGLGCGLLAFGGILASFDKLLCLTSRDNRRIAEACDHLSRFLQAGCDRFTGTFSLVCREDLTREV